ncbi:MAG: hypothetical protein HQ567_35170, partial [Candidatus Nealsonbacteria bacterium]|nr:hypothetical protein [Candidatus Nealsonbacteria bacterium]
MRFRRTLVAFTVALVALCIVAGSVQAAPVVNSSFEDDTFGVSPGYISGNGNTSDSITGWIATANDKIGLNTAAGPFADGGTIPAGNQVALIQNSVGVTGSLSQTITGLDIGQTYRVFYNYNGRTGYEFPKIKVSMGGTVLQENEFIPVGAAGNTNPYYAGAREFTATATEHELKFENTRNVGDSTLLVDNIIVEPNTEWGPTIYAWNDDFSSGIDPTATYTHAVNFGGADVTINGIDFTGAAGPDPSGANYSTTGMQNTFINDANNVTGDGAVMANDFLYGGDPSQLTLTGLTPGTEYIATIYTVGFDNQPGSRIASFAASAGAVPLGDLVTFNQNEMGNNNGMAISFRFPAPDTSITIDVDPYTANTWHYYGFSNMEAPLEYNLLWNGDAGDLLWHSANWTGPVATPDANTNTTIINDTVAVSANAAARKLTVLSGGIAIDADWSLDVSLGATFAPGTTLTLGDRASLSAQDVNVGPGAIVTLADGAALVVDSGTIATMTTTGDAAIETRTNNLSVASLTAAAGTISKRGAGALILGSGATVNPATVFKVEQGTLATSGMNPLGPAEVVELAGGTLLVEGGVTGQSAPANAVAHYAFDAEVAGVTPNTGDAGATLDGTLLGNAALTSGGRGISGEAMQFSGGYVEVPYDAALALNEFTVSAWVNVDSDPVTNNGILGTRIGAGNTFDVKVSSNMIHADIGGVNNAWISTAVDIGAGDTGTTGQGGDLGGGEWHLVTYVIDDTNKKFDLYLDGDLKRTITYPADRTPRFMADTQVLWIGDDYAGHEPMVGRIDDVYIYDRALDSMEVGNLWGDGVTIDMATDLLVTADSTLHATAPGPGGMPAQFADLTLKNGTLTTAGVSQGVQFNSTTIHADATAVGFGPQTATDYGTITNSSAMPEVIVSKTGSGTWELGTPFSGTTDNIKWNVEEGTFAVTGDNTLSGQPITIADGVLDAASAASIGSSPVEMTGGTLSVRLPALKNLSSGIDETSGSPIADGDPDPRYVLTVSPQDLPEDLPKPATVILNHPSWLANDEISKWIGPVNPGITDVAAGDYTIEAELDLTGFDIETVAIVGKLASDNSITDVLLNGFSTGFTQAGFGGLSPAQIIDMGLVDGVNTLTFVLNNSGATATPGGLRVEVGLYQAEQILDLSATAITVNGGGTLDLHGPWAAEVGSVVLKTGALTTAGTIAETIFGGTTLDVEAVDV